MDFSALIGHQDMLTPGTPDVARIRADAAMLLTKIDQKEQLHTEKVIPLPAGMWNALFRLEPAGIVAKLSVGDSGFEVDFLREAHALGVPVPQVFSAGLIDHPEIGEVGYFLMSYISNSANAWHHIHTAKTVTIEDIEQLGSKLGENLAKLHQVELGYITRFGTDVDTWQESITDGFSPDWNTIKPNALFDDELLPILRRALDETGYLSFKNGTLIHCDLNLSNVLVDLETNDLTAILDPAGYAGMPMFDLGYASMPWDHGFEFHHAMLESYKQHSTKFDPALFYTSILVVAYRHQRFHTPEVKKSIFNNILPHLRF